MGDGTNKIQASNVLDDYSVIYLNGDEESNKILFRCVSGLGPPDGNTNDVIGDLYFNNTPLTKGMCNGFLQVEGALPVNPGVLNVQLCGNLTTSTEGIYTCRLMNSSMMYQNMSVGIYFIGRSKLHNYQGLFVSSYILHSCSRSNEYTIINICFGCCYWLFSNINLYFNWFSPRYIHLDER